MRIEFECAGGYGGLFAARPLDYRVESDDLPEDRREKLLALVASSGLLDMADAPDGAGHGQGQARDVFTYKLSIRDQSTSRSFDFDDVTAPEKARPLLNYLRELAIEARMR